MPVAPDWIKISASNFMGRCILAMRRWPRDQKSKLEVNSRDVGCVVLSDYNIYLNQIWYRAQTPLTRQNGQIHIPPETPRWRPPPSWIFRLCEKRTVNNSGLDKDICITFYGIMHWTLAYTTACTTVPHSHFNATVAVSLSVYEISSDKEWRDLENWVTGRSRSLEMLPFDSSHRSSY